MNLSIPPLGKIQTPKLSFCAFNLAVRPSPSIFITARSAVLFFKKKQTNKTKTHPVLQSLTPLLALLNGAAVASTLDELEALGLVVGQTSLKQHGVDAELRVQQRHVAVHLDEEVDALVAFVEMRVVVRKGLRAAGTAESPTGCYL